MRGARYVVTEPIASTLTVEGSRVRNVSIGFGIVLALSIGVDLTFRNGVTGTRLLEDILKAAVLAIGITLVGGYVQKGKRGS